MEEERVEEREGRKEEKKEVRYRPTKDEEGIKDVRE